MHTLQTLIEFGKKCNVYFFYNNHVLIFSGLISSRIFLSSVELLRRNGTMSDDLPPLPARSDSLTEASLPQGHPVTRSYKCERSSESTPSSTTNSDTGAAINYSQDDSQSVLDLDISSHFDSSFSTFRQFYDNGQLWDIEVKVGEKSFKCHRILLAAISQYFYAMFMSEMAESRQNTVTIHDIEEGAMEKLIEFAYTSKIQISVDNVQQLLYAAFILQIETVAQACCQFMKTHLHPVNCIGVHNFAVQHNRTELIKMADDYMLENFLEIIQTEEYKNISFDLLKTLGSSSELNVGDETEVYEAVMMWIQHDIDNRKTHLPEIMSEVRLPLLNPSYLQQHVATNSLIRNSIECRDYLDEAKFYHMSLASLVQKIPLSRRTRARKSYAGKFYTKYKMYVLSV